MAVVVLMLAAGCSQRKSGLGAGEDVDVCRAHKELDALIEPRADRPNEILAYAEAMLRILDRAKPKLPIRRPNVEPLVPPPTIVTDIDLMRRELQSFRTRVRATRADAGALRASVAAFAVNETYDGADARFGQFAAKSCPR